MRKRKSSRDQREGVVDRFELNSQGPDFNQDQHLVLLLAFTSLPSDTPLSIFIFEKRKLFYLSLFLASPFSIYKISSIPK